MRAAWLLLLAGCTPVDGGSGSGDGTAPIPIADGGAADAGSETDAVRGDGGVDPDAAPEPSLVTLGTGSSEFEELEAGGLLQIESGFQGGYHVWGSWRAHELPVAEVEFALRLRVDGEVVAEAGWMHEKYEDDPLEMVGVAVQFFEDPLRDYTGSDAQLEVSLTHEMGTDLDVRPVQLACCEELDGVGGGQTAIIRGVWAEPDVVEAGDRVQLGVWAEGAARWSAAAGSFADANASDTVWTAPAEPGVYAIRVEVTAGDAHARASVSVTVEAAPGGPDPSPGCGREPEHPAGGVNVTIDAGPEGDGERRFHLVRPANYDPGRAHRLIVAYPGTNWVGEQIRPYLDLERWGAGDEIFVYPDPLWRDFSGWGNLGGWVLGPHAQPADGMGDLMFTAQILDYVADRYCVDPDRVFATGHSWGGDMAQVVACFLGDRFAASTPVAANRPYWFETDAGGRAQCVGETAVWTFYGIADDHFAGSEPYAGAFGDECRDFWLAERGCDGVEAADALDYGAPGDCVVYRGCGVDTRYCLYGPETGHQVPGYYAEATMEYFRSF